jgi:uncharacterized RDD family membrane protein YckC
MSQSGQPGAPQPGGAPPPPPPSWQSTPQPPAPPAGGPPPAQQAQMPSWANSMMDRTPIAGPAGYYYADIPNRFIAYIIDAIIVGIVGFIVAAVIGGIFGGTVNTNPLSPNFGSVNYVSLIVVAVVGLAINAAYFIYTWVAMRGTVGMRLLGMQIGNEQDGRTLTYNQAAIRWVFLFGPFALAQFLSPWPTLGLLIELIAFIYLIALLVTTAQSPTKQGIHDKQAHTMVVKAARMAA